MDDIVNYNPAFLEAKIVLAMVVVILFILILYKENKKKGQVLLLIRRALNISDPKIKERECVCDGKKIKISQPSSGFGNDYVESYSSFGLLTSENRNNYVTRIETGISNNAFKPKLIPKPLFELKRKGADNAKWIYFENSFDIKNKLGLHLSSETRSKLKQLFVNGYFRGPMSLKIFPPDRAVLPQRVKIVFDLLPKIMQDENSLKIAMEVVADVAGQMDEMRTGKEIS